MHQLTGVAGISMLALALIGCGQNKTSTIGVIPAFAEAQNFPGGVVPFTATGVPNPTWCIGTTSGHCNGNIASAASIDSGGHALCSQGRSGTVTVLAGTDLTNGLPDTGGQLSAFGNAQLTCHEDVRARSSPLRLHKGCPHAVNRDSVGSHDPTTSQ